MATFLVKFNDKAYEVDDSQEVTVAGCDAKIAQIVLDKAEATNVGVSRQSQLDEDSADCEQKKLDIIAVLA